MKIVITSKMKIGIKNTVSTNLSGIEQSAMNSLRGRRLRGGRGGGGGSSIDSGRATSPKVSLTRSLAPKCSFPSLTNACHQWYAI